MLGSLLRRIQFPPAVVHDVRIIDVRADEERVVLFQEAAPVKIRLCLENPAREQHADGLAANKPGADHAALERQQVFKGKIPAGELEDIVLQADEMRTTNRDMTRGTLLAPTVTNSM